MTVTTAEAGFLSGPEALDERDDAELQSDNILPLRRSDGVDEAVDLLAADPIVLPPSPGGS